jgi:hypothetical protein
MPITRRSYLVELEVDGESIEHTVELRHADQLRGELEANKHGLPALNEAPLNHTTVWIWCALVRSGYYAGDFRQFKLVDLVGFEAIKESAVDVDPTQRGPESEPASSS